jgi:hypothetical protein
LAGAGVNQAAGRIRPAGRQLGIAALHNDMEWAAVDSIVGEWKSWKYYNTHTGGRLKTYLNEKLPAPV